MRKDALLAGLVVAALFMVSGCAQRTALFNGTDLSGWDFYLADTSVDASKVWMVKDGVVHCAGKPNGYMQTEEEYSDYKLHLEWRWVDKPSNSGVLLHKQGADRLWPNSIECQLMAENAGDFWLIHGASITANGKVVKGARGGASNVKKMKPSNEKTPGKWNKYDIFCEGASIWCYVNGVLQNEGTRASQSKGKICLQSEGAAIEFRNIYIEEL